MGSCAWLDLLVWTSCCRCHQQVPTSVRSAAGLPAHGYGSACPLMLPYVCLEPNECEFVHTGRGETRCPLSFLSTSTAWIKTMFSLGTLHVILCAQFQMSNSLWDWPVRPAHPESWPPSHVVVSVTRFSQLLTATLQLSCNSSDLAAAPPPTPVGAAPHGHSMVIAPAYMQCPAIMSHRKAHTQTLLTQHDSSRASPKNTTTAHVTNTSLKALPSATIERQTSSTFLCHLMKP
jgi:hypothetical protein